MSEIKREQLLDAGLKLLSEKTFSEISMDLVAEKSGLSKPMIYYYFDNKEGYYNALALHLLSISAEEMKSMFTAELSLRENLRQYIRARLDLVEKEPGLVRAYMHMLYDPNIGLMVNDLGERFESLRTELIDPLFEKAVEDGEVAPSIDKYLVMMMVHSTLIGHTMKTMSGVAPEFMPDPMGMVDVIFDGIGIGKPEGGSE